MKGPTFKVTTDITKQVNEVIKTFQKSRVLVGTPEDTTDRKSETQITNATLLALCTFGSAANNIPPWPVLSIGIENSKEAWTNQMRDAAVDGLTNGAQAASMHYNRAGIIASTEIKKVINEQIEVPADKPSEATLKAREAKGFRGGKYWLVTGQLRNSITYVVEEA